MIQVPIRVAVGQWSRTFHSENLFTQVLNLNNFYGIVLFFVDPERFE